MQGRVVRSLPMSDAIDLESTLAASIAGAGAKTLQGRISAREFDFAVASQFA
jgi:hypothetical protein